MQDVVPKGDRSIRNIPVPANRRAVPPPTAIRVPPRRPEEPPKRRFRFSALWLLVGAVLASLLGLIVASFFDGAKVTVYPKKETVTIDTVINATIDAPVGQVPYQIMKTDRSVTRTLAATGEERVERRASGIITIYNEFSTASQRLIKNTRFETPNGKIYRINDSITVPGGTKRADGGIAPGTIDVTVYADSPGADYNQEPTQFTIPGFKGDPRYSKFYARSKTALSGGFTGLERVVPEAQLSHAVEDMKQELGGILTSAAADELPEGYLMVSGGLRFVFEEPVRENAEGKDVTVRLSGAATAPIVRERDLASAVARLTVAGYEGDAVLFADRSALTLSLPSGTPSPGQETITIAVAGAPTLVWQFDTEALRASLAGQDRAIFEEVIRGYEPEVSRATASIRPFFRASFPEDPAEVEVVIGDEE